MPFAACLDLHSTVGARVDEDLHLAGRRALEDDRATADVAGAEVVRVLDLRLVADEEPAAVEDAATLLLQDRVVHHGRSVDSEARRVAVIDHVTALGRAGHPRGAPGVDPFPCAVPRVLAHHCQVLPESASIKGTADADALHFAPTLEDVEDLRVPVPLLQREILSRPFWAEQLHAPADHPLERRPSVGLRPTPPFPLRFVVLVGPARMGSSISTRGGADAQTESAVHAASVPGGVATDNRVFR